MTDSAGDVMDRVVPLHPLVYLDEGDEVTIGRPETDSYAIFPPDGAEVVRRLGSGATPGEVARWYESEYGEQVDVADVVAALAELGFVREAGDAPAAGRVRWQRLGQALFSPVAWAGYAGLVAWAVVAMVRAPDLVPTYSSVFFTEYYSVVEVTLIVGVLPLLLLHEAFHALAGRRLGVRSRLRISRRLYLVVLETGMDGLVAVPRRRRYLPILAGMLFDLVATALFVLAADLTRDPDGGLSFAGRLCLALAFTTLLRLVWQFSFYLRTDLYVLVATALGCVDLHAAAVGTLGNRVDRLRGRPPRADPDRWHPTDRRVARWYSWLVLLGYGFTLGTLVLAVVPVLWRTAVGVAGRLVPGGDDPGTGLLLDSIVLLVLTAAQIGASLWIGARERRRARSATALRHVIA